MVEELRRTLKRKVPLLAFFGGLAMLLHPLLRLITSLGRYTLHECYMFAFATGDFTPFAAFFPAVMFATVFAEDYASGGIRMCMFRTGRMGYIRQRILTTIMGGGFSMAAYVILVLLFSAAFVRQPGTAESADLLSRTLWGRYEFLTDYGGAGMYACKIVLAFLFGAVWALFGLAVSALTANIYCAVIVPLGVYMGLWYFLAGNPFNPIYLLRGDTTILPSVGFIFAVQLAAMAVLAAVSGLLIYRRTQ
ncbi:MAG: hypothetical protein IJH99_04205 [Eubacterium sp.]|nr:hypothetical protein [Eubacterium sp.]